MDPNDTLKRILELCQWHSAYGFLPPDESDEFIEKFKDLHEWLMKGGFLPELWSDKIKERPRWIESADPWQSPTALKKEEPF